MDGTELVKDETTESLKILLESTRSLLRSTSPEEVVGILMRTVRMAGGQLVPAADASSDTTPLDISLGQGAPLLADLPKRGLVSRSFPRLVEDARWMVHRLEHLERVEEDATVDALTG
ncbi:MAG: hypothetical protein ACLGHL_10270, partial [Actinomycetota bacterium]